MLAIVRRCVCEFWDKILLKGEECKTRKMLNFFEKWQNSDFSILYKLKTLNFSRSRMTKWTSSLGSSREV